MQILDNNIVCPISGQTLCILDDDQLISESGVTYQSKDGIHMLFVEEPHKEGSESSHPADNLDRVSNLVKGFYSEAPFPNYNEYDNIKTFIKKAENGLFASLLKDQIPNNANILEIGCGTAQLSNYLAAATSSRVYAADMTPASLRLGLEFARRNAVQGITFVQTNLFMPPFRPESMDIVISNGVLHHTYDTKKAFRSISKMVKPGGHIIIGLYNHIGRLRTDFRRLLVKSLGERILFLDPHLRNSLSDQKRRAWINDQYYHPEERKHSISELMEWFDEAGFDFVSSIPKIFGEFGKKERLFASQNPGNAFDRFIAEFGMLFSSLGGEGGLFICIGKKRHNGK